jgi:hypothetical protein
MQNGEKIWPKNLPYFCHTNCKKWQKTAKIDQNEGQKGGG